MKKTLILHFIVSISLFYGAIYYLEPQMSGLLLLIFMGSFFFVFWLFTFLFHKSYFLAFRGALNLAVYFVKELIVSNIKIIYYIASPGRNFRPAILEFPLRLKSNFGITLLANLITLTPGTITLEISDDKKYLYFHIVNVPEQNVEKAKHKLKDGFEKRIMKITS